MKIRTEYDPPAIPDRRWDWSAINDSDYDGASDSNNRHQVGYGATEQAAIDDLLAILEASR